LKSFNSPHAEVPLLQQCLFLILPGGFSSGLSNFTWAGLLAGFIHPRYLFKIMIHPHSHLYYGLAGLPALLLLRVLPTPIK
jgi:hypothetical protein